MMIEDLRWYSCGILTKYPHIWGDDTDVITQFWKVYKSAFRRVTYDVPVGDGRPIPPGTTIEMFKDWQYVTSHKIDMLIDTEFSYWLCEVKKFAQVGALGQLLAYKDLFQTTYKIYIPIFLKLITIDLHPDLLRTADKYQIEIIKLPPFD
jgi:hypothetical protein